MQDLEENNWFIGGHIPSSAPSMVGEVFFASHHHGLSGDKMSIGYFFSLWIVPAIG